MCKIFWKYGVTRFADIKFSFHMWNKWSFVRQVTALGLHMDARKDSHVLHSAVMISRKISGCDIELGPSNWIMVRGKSSLFLPEKLF